MAPTCTNCNGTDFVWVNELKTGGVTGTGSLSLRPRGEIPLGTRICKTCGHAELFLRDVSILHSPHLWRPSEFIPIPGRPKPPATLVHHAHAAEPAPSAPAPMEPMAPPPPPPPPPPEPVPEPPVEPAPVAEPAAEEPPAVAAEAAPDSAPAPAPERPKSTRRRPAKPKTSS
ncbi:MAG TPA: hypothetical protein VLX64_04395 [Thermoplasmata archaeon]|nr:hypothetical protein [Thermoplasmata archaeon]